jgi:capsular polysaccharide transport system permease protein
MSQNTPNTPLPEDPSSSASYVTDPTSAERANNEHAETLPEDQMLQRRKMAQRRRKELSLVETRGVEPLQKLSEPPAPPSTPIFPVGAPQTPAQPMRTRRRFRWALVFVGLPTLAAAIYFWFYASDQYYARSDFAIRTHQSSPMEGLALFGMAGASSPAVADMFIVRDYLQSRQILEDLKPRIDLRKIYSNPDADWLVRLDPTVTEEELLDYWQGMSSVKYDATTGITSLGIRAFTPQDAKTVAENVLQLSEALVNRLSDRAQSDRLRLAEEEVAQARERATKALDALQSHQQEARQVDPASFAVARSEIQSRLEQQISQYETQIERLRQELPDDAPGVQLLGKSLAVTKAQLDAEKMRSTQSDNGESASEVLNNFHKLKLESEFAAKAYDSALASLEAARLEAAAQSRYLEAFVRPQLPEYPEFPWRILNVIIVALASALVWGIGSLVIAAIREH